MYGRIKVRDTVRVPPDKLGENLNEIIEELLWENFEGRLDKKYGMIVCIESIEEVGEGKIIEGDGGIYFDVVFNAIMFKPVMQEIVEGVVNEIVEFGAFISLGPLDGLLHMSQITDDYLNYDEKSKRLVGKESKKTIEEGDTVRARIVALSLKEKEPEKSKIGLTMRQPWLGAIKWIQEEKEKLESGG